jgi:regulator of protease activity HflC (stomatin/prohibitin superfamily)
MLVKARPNEYLVVAHRGDLENRGIGGRAFLWPGSSHAFVVATKQEACFAMTQETKDGIPLRLKGTVVYRVIDPVQAMRHFDFTPDGAGHSATKDLINHLCLGYLRAVVSHMTMEECIEQRETTLTGHLVQELQRVIGDPEAIDRGSRDWGIELDVVQVAQVFIVDEELRRQLEAEVRDKIKATSELSQIRTHERLQLAQINAARDIRLQEIETERADHEVAKEKLRLQKELDAEQIEAHAETQLLQSIKRRDVLEQERTTRQLAAEVKALEVEEEMLSKRAEQGLRKEILVI